jgi:hypothetical protein
MLKSYTEYCSNNSSKHPHNFHYKPEELSKTKYNLALITKMPGNASYDLVVSRYKNIKLDAIQKERSYISKKMGSRCFVELVEPKILQNTDGFDYVVAVRKTFWVKILQRKWRNYMKNKTHTS